jgi:hypothetical protein
MATAIAMAMGALMMTRNEGVIAEDTLLYSGLESFG